MADVARRNEYRDGGNGRLSLCECKRLWYLRSSLMLRCSYKTPYRGRNNSSVAGNSNATFLSTSTTRRNNGQAIPPSSFSFSFVTTIPRVPFELRDGPIARSKDSLPRQFSFFFPPFFHQVNYRSTRKTKF